MIPPIFILAAQGASELYRRLEPHAPRPALMAVAPVLFASVIYDAYHSYFDVWAKDPNVAGAFGAPCIDIADGILALPASAPSGDRNAWDDWKADSVADGDVPDPELHRETTAPDEHPLHLPRTRLRP
jgi:hypothetical protein